MLDALLFFGSLLGTPNFDEIWDVATDNNGYIYLAGAITREVETDALIVKIDPKTSTLIYVKEIGGTGTDKALGIDADSDGNAYVTGQTDAFNFPISNGAYFDENDSDTRGAFILKISSDGSQIYYSTSLGNAFARGLDVVVDENGNAYMTGESGSLGGTNTTDVFPTTNGSFGACQNGGRAFLSKISPDGSSLIYAGCIEAFSDGYGVDINSNNQAYIVGYTSDANFPVTSGAYDSECDLPYCSDGFVTKINADGTSIVFSTLFGGGYVDNIQGVSVDCDGSVHITGQTKSEDLEWSQNLYGPNELTSTTGDAFVAKLSPDGTALEYLTYLGTTSFDVGWDIEASCDGRSYVTGVAGGYDFPVTPDALQNDTLRDDAFITVIERDGSKLVFSTLLGGDGAEEAHGIDIDANGNIYIGGNVNIDPATDNFPLVNPLEGDFSGGYVNGDGFVFAISTNTSPYTLRSKALPAIIPLLLSE